MISKRVHHYGFTPATFRRRMRELLESRDISSSSGYQPFYLFLESIYNILEREVHDGNIAVLRPEHVQKAMEEAIKTLRPRKVRKSNHIS